MANYICTLEGVRGRGLVLYDTKCVFTTKVTAGSIITKNATDGDKTIFYCDIIGIQFKKSGFSIGYLQLETGSGQMNNDRSNFFSENTFTFEHGKGGLTNEIMEKIHDYIVDRVEEIKYGVKILEEVPDFFAAAEIPEQTATYYTAEEVTASPKKNEYNPLLTDAVPKKTASKPKWKCVCGRTVSYFPCIYCGEETMDRAVLITSNEENTPKPTTAASEPNEAAPVTEEAKTAYRHVPKNKWKCVCGKTISYFPCMYCGEETNERAELIVPKEDTFPTKVPQKTEEFIVEEVHTEPDTPKPQPKKTTWVCRQCGASNPQSSRMCQSCGAYK